MPEREVHESISVNGEMKRLKNLLWHYTYRNWEDQKARSLKYATLWAKQKEKEGKVAKVHQAMTHSCWTFFRAYGIKKGFLDGFLGFRIACAVAKEVYQKYSMLHQLNQKVSR